MKTWVRQPRRGRERVLERKRESKAQSSSHSLSPRMRARASGRTRPKQLLLLSPHWVESQGKVGAGFSSLKHTRTQRQRQRQRQRQSQSQRQRQCAGREWSSAGTLSTLSGSRVRAHFFGFLCLVSFVAFFRCGQKQRSPLSSSSQRLPLSRRTHGETEQLSTRAAAAIAAEAAQQRQQQY